MLDVKQLARRAGGLKILSEISFAHQAGGVLAVLGPSGSGKTTLLRLLMGLEVPERGSIAWRGNLLSGANQVLILPEARKFAMVFQDAALFPHLSVVDNIAFGLSRQPAKMRREQANHWLEKLNIAHLQKRHIGFLSGGERQRVALARALAPGPEMLLLDEPFSNVDRFARRGLIESLRKIIEKENLTVVVVTHDARDALDLGAKALMILNEGKMALYGLTLDILKTPRNDWAHDFISCSLGPDYKMETK